MGTARPAARLLLLGLALLVCGAAGDRMVERAVSLGACWGAGPTLQAPSQPLRRFPDPHELQQGRPGLGPAPLARAPRLEPPASGAACRSLRHYQQWLLPPCSLPPSQEVAPQPARVQTMVMVHGGRVVGVMQHVQLGRRFGPPELPPGAPDPAAECGQPQGGLSALLNWTACMVRCMRSRPTATAGQMEIVQMHLARAAAVVGATHGGPLPGATTPGFPGAAAEEQPAAMPLARPRGMPLTQRWQWDVNVPVPAEQQAPADDDQLDSAAAQQLLGTEQLPAAATAEAEPRAAPWWWPMGHARRPARGAAGGEEAAEGCHCKHCGCHHHHHGGKHHHHSHSEDGQPAPAQQLPMMMAALHDLAQQHAQQAADAQQAQRGHHGAPRHGNRDQLLPGVATPFEFIAQERAQGFTDRWTELQAAQHPGG